MFASLNASPAAVQAYQSGFYTWANTQQCSACHAAGPAPQQFWFASTDMMTAYADASALVDFNNPDASVLVTYSGNGHCGNAICSDSASPAKVKTYLESWATAALASGGNPGVTGLVMPKYLTPSVQVPASIPSLVGGKSATMSFPLSQLNPAFAGFSGATFTFNIQIANPTAVPPEYHITNPKITGLNNTVSITGIHVLIKGPGVSGIGSEDINQGNLWDNVTVQATSAATSLESGSLDITATSTMLNDSLTVGFDNLQ